MDIKGVNGNQAQQSYNNVNFEKKNRQINTQPGGTKFSDKLEISEDAKKLTEEKVDVAKVNMIKKRIDAGFYNSDAVISKVAERILKEIG